MTEPENLLILEALTAYLDEDCEEYNKEIRALINKIILENQIDPALLKQKLIPHPHDLFKN